MSLTTASALYYWSARYGSVPVIGGRPVHTRNSAGMAADQRGAPYSAIINTPRFRWDTLSSERRQTLLLEFAATNRVLYSSDFSNAAWTKTNMTVSTGFDDPMGGTSACALTATAANATVEQAFSGLASVSRNNSLWIRRRTGTGAVYLREPGTANYDPQTITSQWARYSDVGNAATTSTAGIKLATSGDAVDVWCYQNEDNSFPTSEIQTTSAAVTRSADSFYSGLVGSPQALMLYVKFIEAGTIKTSGQILLSIGSAAGGAPEFYIGATAGKYQAYFNGKSSVLAAAPIVGDTVELVVTVTSANAVQIIQSVNGAAVSSGSLSTTTTLPAAWADQRVWFNSEGTLTPGCVKMADCKMVKYADVAGATPQAILTELAGYEIGPNGDLLSAGS